MSTTIDSFSGQYGFLSNFHPASVVVAGYHAPTVEHGFQAWKAASIADMERVLAARTPREAKSIGRAIAIRDDWEQIKVDVMKVLIAQKFKPGTEFAEKLLDTGDAVLVEGNDWGDTFWGRCGDHGVNMLGIILMQQRVALMQHRAKWQRGDALHDPDGTLNWQARWNGTQGPSSVIVQSGQDFTLTSVLGQVRFQQPDAATVATMLQHAADAVREIAEG